MFPLKAKRELQAKLEEINSHLEQQVETQDLRKATDDKMIFYTSPQFRQGSISYDQILSYSGSQDTNKQPRN